jgi:putative SOS response-associated peptidase YedK
MCGRLAITRSPAVLRAFFRYLEQPNFPPRYNVAPTQPVPIVRLERDASGGTSRHFVLVRWGFLPGFVKDPKDFPLVINARAETVGEKASFRNALKRRRCIFIADAFYEWRRQPGGRRKGSTPPQPYLFRRRDGNSMALAGLWETWAGPHGEELDTACIVTTFANGTMAALHDRMPVILEPDGFDRWLDCDSTGVDEAARLMRPAEEDVLEFFPIGPAVNHVANDDPGVQEPIGAVGRLTLAVQPGEADLFGRSPS